MGGRGAISRTMRTRPISGFYGEDEVGLMATRTSDEGIDYEEAAFGNHVSFVRTETEDMKVRYIGETTTNLINGRIYVVLFVEAGWYRIKDERGEENLYPPQEFEVV